MGYFSNGAENDAYVARWCDRCANQDDEGGCPIMDAHFVANYSQLDDGQGALKEVLGYLIARDRDGKNLRCRMFRDVVEE